MRKGKLLIQIRGTGFSNKGAELMLYSVLEKIKYKFPDAEFCMEPKTPFFKRAALNFYQIAELRFLGFEFGVLAKFIPERIRERYGLGLIKEIDIVIDASGFKYSDQWGKDICIELAESCKRWKNNGTKVILLPQAFGPFMSKLNQKSIKKALKYADLIFARENISYEYLTNLVGERSNLKIAPDFTNLIKGIIPENFDNKINRFCIIPNYRMIDKTNKKESEAYLPFMIKIAHYAYKNDMKPFILVHGDINDKIIAEKIRDSVSSNIQIIEETNPLKIKGILGVSTAIISSRYHGIISGLSQGVPTLATGWSHKYKMLFEEFEFKEGLLDVNMNIDELHLKINLIINEHSRKKIINSINNQSKIQTNKTKKMWDDVFLELEDKH